jgi:exosome complex component RRP4
LKNSESKKRYVLPGDVITTAPLRLQANVTLEGKRIISTAIGLSDVSYDSVRVIPLSGIYLPKVDDLVIGMIKYIHGNSWFADINSCYEGMLLAKDVFGRGSNATLGEMKASLDKSDLILARIANSDRTREPLLSISGQNLGKIDSGELVKISPTKIPRLIGKHGSMIQTIESSTNATITIGQNGLIVLKCDDSAGLKKAIESIKMMDKALHNTNLEEKIQNILDEKN